MIKRIRSWLAARRLGKEQEKQSHDFCHSAVVDRRHIWQMTAGTVGAVAIGSTALQAQTPGCTLSCRSTFELPVVNLPPLDVPVVWQRRHTQSGPPGATHGILALVAEATGDTSFPWPLYIQLTTSHNKGDAVGSTVRLTQLGNGWGAAFHTDVYHQGPSTSIGANIEITKKVDDGRAIGINIQSKGLTTDAAINIQTAPINPSSANAPPQPTGKWNTGIHLDAN